jgi:hypothetical protein
MWRIRGANNASASEDIPACALGKRRCNDVRLVITTLKFSPVMQRDWHDEVRCRKVGYSVREERAEKFSPPQLFTIFQKMNTSLNPALVNSDRS